jgi:hypothetical protein
MELKHPAYIGDPCEDRPCRDDLARPKRFLGDNIDNPQSHRGHGNMQPDRLERRSKGFYLSNGMAALDACGSGIISEGQVRGGPPPTRVTYGQRDHRGDTYQTIMKWSPQRLTLVVDMVR